LFDRYLLKVKQIAAIRGTDIYMREEFIEGKKRKGKKRKVPFIGKTG
jgi:hypothetical protein